MFDAIRQTACVTAIALLLSLACVPVARAQQEPLADHVPSDALLYVGWEGKSRMGDRYEGSKLKSYTEVMNLSAEWTKLTDTIRKEALKSGPDGLTVDALIKFLPTVWDRPWVFYIRELPKDTSVVVQPAGEKPAADPVNLMDLIGVALLIDAGDQATAVQGRLMSLLMLSDNHNLSFEVVGSWVVVQLNLPDLAAELRSGGPAKGQRLSDNPTFRAAMNATKFSGKPSLACFADANRLRESVTRNLKTHGSEVAQRDWKNTQEVYGMDGLESISYAAGFMEKNWTSSLFIAAPVATKKSAWVQWLIDSAPVSPKSPSLVPANASWFSVSLFDLLSTQQMLLKQGSNLAGNLKEVQDPLIEINKVLGFDLGQELLSQVGPEWVVFTDPFTVGNTGMGFVMATPLKDAARVERAMTLLESKANAMIAQGNNGGATIGFPVPAGMQFQVIEQGGIKLHVLNAIIASPTWAIHNGTLYFSPITQAVVAAAQAPDADKSVTRPNAKPLMTQAKSLVPPGGKTLSLSAADLTATAPINYNLAAQFLQMLPMFTSQAGIESITYTLPPLQGILPTLGTATSATWSDEAGYHSRSITPFPTAVATWSPQFTLVGPLLVQLASMLPNVAAVDQAPDSDTAIERAQAIQSACTEYAADSKEIAFPADIGTLCIKDDLGIGKAISFGSQSVPPEDLRKWPKPQQAEWINKNASFVLIPGATPDGSATRIDVVQKLLKPDMTSLAIAYGDNRGENRPVAEVRQLLLKQTGKTLEQLGIAPGGPGVIQSPATTRPASPSNKPAPAATPAPPAGASATPGTTKGAPR